MQFLLLIELIETGNKSAKSATASPQSKPKEKTQLFGTFPKVGKSNLVERTSLIKHTSAKNQEELRRQQNAERTNTNTDNQAFLTDVSNKKLV